MQKLIVWLKAARLKLHILGALPVLTGALIALNKTGQLDFINLMLAEFITIFTLIATALANDYADVETDKKNQDYNMFSGGSRLIVNGVISKGQMLTAAMAASFISLGLAGVLFIFFKGHPLILIFNLVGLFIGLEYSLPPLKINYRGSGEFFVVVMYSLFCLSFGYITQSGPDFDLKILYYSIPIAIGIFLIILITEVPDYASDRISGKKTIPVILGKDISIFIFFLGTLSLYIAIIILYLLGPITKFILRGLFFSLPLGLYAVKLSLGKEKTSPKNMAALGAMAIVLNVWINIVLSLDLVLRP